MTNEVFSSLTFRSGLQLKNRIVKAAMEESLAIPGQIPDKKLDILYRKWAHGGAGMLITGNVMVHTQALTGPACVILDESSHKPPFRNWARAAKVNNTAVIMQINHPGRQVEANMPGVVWGPSAIPVNLGKHSKRFGCPQAMNIEQIQQTIQRFVTSAHLAEKTGFDGVEIHAAHGYLLSQFLSPLSNQRTDDWGGSLENRARILLAIVQMIRETVSSTFSVGVKLNSADFQRGGFDADDARKVIDMLTPLGVDFVEISGGSYESPAMMGRSADSRTQAREAYFLDLAESLVKTSAMPLILTGGISCLSTAQKVIASGIALVGMGTALSLHPNLPHLWQKDQETTQRLTPVNWSDKTLASAATMALVRYQLHRMAHNRNPVSCVHPVYALLLEQMKKYKALRHYRAWLKSRT